MTDDDGMSRGIRAVDGDSIQRAVQTLRDAGFAVDSVTDAEREQHGVAFDLRVFDPNRTSRLADHEADSDEVAADV